MSPVDFAATGTQTRNRGQQRVSNAASGSEVIDIESNAVCRRSVAFAFAQFLGAAIFGVLVGTLYYPLHSGHILVWVPMVLLTVSFAIAAWDLIKGVGRRR